ncbi:MAG: cell envelope integrity protein CreD [Muribaculaceae bacterium]|nr:cell envelope integrity protein CreD [Muribaculaceae bacterium]
MEEYLEENSEYLEENKEHSVESEEIKVEPAYKPKYTMGWLGLQTMFIIIGAFVLALIAGWVDGYSYDRLSSQLLTVPAYNMVSQAIFYCFGVVAITGVSLELVEVAFRKPINYLQYILIGLALGLFYLLLLAMAEQMPFWAAYWIVSAMTIGLIGWFVKGITGIMKATYLTVGLLAVEYAIIFILINIGTLALLIGSVSIFVVIALAMYFTLKLKVENQELVLK